MAAGPELQLCTPRTLQVMEHSDEDAEAMLGTARGLQCEENGEERRGQQTRGRWRRLRGYLIGGALSLLVASAVVAVRAGLAPLGALQPAESQFMWEAPEPECERCPVGRCDLDGSGNCKDWGGSYHCGVPTCSVVPHGMKFSACWWRRGQPYYSVNDADYPCHHAHTTSDGTNDSANGTDNGTANSTADEPLRSPAAAPPSGARTFIWSQERVADTLESHDTRLAAYWDAFACGPGGDDQHSDWCGGAVHAPRCAAEVPVDASICNSGRAAHVATLTVGGDNLPFYVGTCLYIYYAQYRCMASTTSTTRTATTTSSTTTTATTTSTTSTSRTCVPSFQVPAPPLNAPDLNGLRLNDVCFPNPGVHKVFVIGDWGGIVTKHGPKPARQRPKTQLVAGVDNIAQQRVAIQMRIRAAASNPDYVLNVGDSFYWAGLSIGCGTPAYKWISTGQLEANFEPIYSGPGLDGKPWLGVLGNHDYGGYRFNAGWDQLIAYTWGPGGRWVMPAQYWRVTVRYPETSVDYFFADTNVFDAHEPHADNEHNMCSLKHNPEGVSCGQQGPTSIWDCPHWFNSLWEAQKIWLEDGLAGSNADWQVIVTHFPPTWGHEYWADLADRHGIDLFLSGHEHRQALHNDPEGVLGPTPFVVSGGGGGVTSEDIPHFDGLDDQYGFFELTISRDLIEVQGISHGGQLRSQAHVHQRHPARYGAQRSNSSHKPAAVDGGTHDLSVMHYKKLQ